MIPHSTRLAVERIEDRTVPSTVAYGDFNHDGLVDKAAITAPTTIVVSLANPDGNYTASATLTVPTNRPAQGVYVADYDGDGNLDIYATGGTGANKQYTHCWVGNGDGTFGSMTTSEFNLAKMKKWV